MEDISNIIEKASGLKKEIEALIDSITALKTEKFEKSEELKFLETKHDQIKNINKELSDNIDKLMFQSCVSDLDVRRSFPKDSTECIIQQHQASEKIVANEPSTQVAQKTAEVDSKYNAKLGSADMFLSSDLIEVNASNPGCSTSSLNEVRVHETEYNASGATYINCLISTKPISTELGPNQHQTSINNTTNISCLTLTEDSKDSAQQRFNASVENAGKEYISFRNAKVQRAKEFAPVLDNLKYLRFAANNDVSVKNGDEITSFFAEQNKNGGVFYGTKAGLVHAYNGLNYNGFENLEHQVASLVGLECGRNQGKTNMVFAGLSNGTVHFMENLNTGISVKSSFALHSSLVKCIYSSMEISSLISCSLLGLCVIQDLETGKTVRNLNIRGSIKEMDLHPNCCLLAFATSAPEAGGQFWDIRAPKCISIIAGPVKDISIAANGRDYFTLHEGGLVKHMLNMKYNRSIELPSNVDASKAKVDGSGQYLIFNGEQIGVKCVSSLETHYIAGATEKMTDFFIPGGIIDGMWGYNLRRACVCKINTPNK